MSAVRFILMSAVVMGLCCVLAFTVEHGCRNDDVTTAPIPYAPPAGPIPPRIPAPPPWVKNPLPVAKPVGDPTENSVGMVLVPIPAGEFYMGSPESEDARTGSETVHRVKLTKSFHLGRTEVTQGQWKAVMGTTPWEGKYYATEGDDYPATYVSWYAAAAFCRKLSEKEGIEYRLPTEAEWEYACRAGTTTAYSFGDDGRQLYDYAWFSKNKGTGRARYGPHIVGQKKPNPWGLHDMHGNVAEWCQDWKNRYPNGDVTDPVGPPQGKRRVLRGGLFEFDAPSLRSAYRIDLLGGHSSVCNGFRVVRTNP